MLKIPSKHRQNSDLTASNDKLFMLFSILWNNALLPILIGVLITKSFDQENGGLVALLKDYWFVFVIAIVIHIFVMLASISSAKKHETIFEHIDLKNSLESAHKEIEALKSNRDRLSKIRDYQTGIINVLTDTLKNVPNTDTSVFQKQVLSLLEQNREHLFEYTSLSKYNICLYLYNHENDQLEVSERLLDSRIYRQDRAWKRGRGHVGISFAQKRCLICDNIHDNPELESSPDNKTYISFISTPIVAPMVGGESPDPYGVLVLTSATPNQFKINQDDDFLMVISDIISINITFNRMKGDS